MSQSQNTNAKSFEKPGAMITFFYHIRKYSEN